MYVNEIIGCVMFLILLAAGFKLNKIREYYKSDYAKQTKNPYWSVINNKGRFGEYKISRILGKVKGYKKVIYNSYIPYSDKTTEIDLILIHETGIYVIESKNYAGSIFGSVSSNKWCQLFPNGKKYYFYSPVLQNGTHIRLLRKHLDRLYQNKYTSIVVFGSECRIKKGHIKESDLYVIELNELPALLHRVQKKQKILTKEQITNIYTNLYSRTIISPEEKQKHINQIKKIS